MTTMLQLQDLALDSTTRGNPWWCGLFTTLLLTLLGCAHEGGPDLNVDLERQRGRNALLSGRPDWARHHYGRVVEHREDDLEAWRRLGQAWGQGQEGGLSRAIEAYERALALGPSEPDEVEIRLGMARSWHRLGDPGRALAVLPPGGDPRIAVLRARCLLDRDPEAAWRAIDSALTTTSKGLDAAERAEHHRLAAEVAFRRDDPDLALDHVRRAVDLDPLEPGIHFLASRVHRRLGDAEATTAALGRFQTLQRIAGAESVEPPAPAERLALLRGLQPELPDAFPVRQRLALLTLEVEGRPEALSALETVRDDPAQTAPGLLALAQAAQRRGWVLEALDLYRAVLDKRPEQAVALSQGAVLAAELGESETADRWLDHALAADPDRSLFHAARGRVLLQRDDGAGAETSLRRAVELAPWEVADRLLLAELLMARGDREGTTRLLDEAPAAEAALTAYRRKHSL